LSLLSALKGQLAEEAAAIRETHRRARDAVRLVSDTHLAIERRVIELTLGAMQRQGEGEPPVLFAILVMGSGGRREMLLNPDQDNGLILAETPEAAQPHVQSWFTRFAERMNLNLAAVGYALCPGYLMARNPMCRRTLCSHAICGDRHGNDRLSGLCWG
jgi:CBS domain-containing protein